MRAILLALLLLGCATMPPEKAAALRDCQIMCDEEFPEFHCSGRVEGPAPVPHITESGRLVTLMQWSCECRLYGRIHQRRF